MKPFVSVIVATLNSEKTIKECLQALEEIDYPRHEIIVVDGCSKDKTIEITKKFRKVKLLKTDPSAGGQRNLGVKKAKGKLIAFTDSDCIVEKQWLKELVKIFEKHPADKVGGPNIIENKKYQKILSSSPGTHYCTKHKQVVEINHLPLCNSIIKKKVFLDTGGFREDLFPGEDIEFDYRLKKKGYRIFFTPHARLLHKKNHNIISFAKQMFNFGLVKGQMTRERTYFSWIHTLPMLFTIYLVILPFSQPIFAIPLTLYLPLILGLGGKHFYIFPIEHLSYGLGFIVGLLWHKTPKSKIQNTKLRSKNAKN